MSIFSKNALSSFFGLSGEEDYDYDEYEEQEGVAQQPLQQPTRQSVQRAQNEYETPIQHTEPLNERPSARYRSTETQQDKRESRQETAFNEKKVVSIRNSKRSQEPSGSYRPGKITIIEPRVYSEAKNIAKHIIASDAVLINFHLVEEMQARRIVDFLTGTVYALDGDIQRVGDEIFLCTPSTIEIDSATAQSLAKNQMFDF